MYFFTIIYEFMQKYQAECHFKHKLKHIYIIFGMYGNVGGK